jgi:hypothetical protein
LLTVYIDVFGFIEKIFMKKLGEILPNYVSNKAAKKISFASTAAASVSLEKKAARSNAPVPLIQIRKKDKKKRK